MSDGSHGITTGSLARRLGVSPTTVRSWDRRYGIGPAARPDGHHRRWGPGDVAMLEEMCRLTASGVPPAEAARAALRARTAGVAARDDAPAPGRAAAGSGLPLGAVRQECRGLARAAVRLDGPAVEGMLQEVLERYGLVTAWEDVMAPTLHAVGRKWESSDDRYVEVEHLLSWHISTALRRATVTGSAEPSAGPPVVLACVPAEQHTLPLEALTAGLAEQGLPIRMFGAAVPAEALDAAVRRSGPAAVALWSQARSTADHALARHVAATAFGVRGARRTPLVMLAGPGWLGRTPAPGMVRPSGLREAIGLVSRLYADHAAGPGA
ncbi:MerR family transcriptional regulator [Streptomyces sp. NPDC004779]